MKIRNLSSVPNNMGGRGKWLAVDRINIKSVKGLINAEEWSLKHDHPQISLTVGENKLNALQNEIKDISNGKGDYSIGHAKGTKYSESSCLWF